MNSTLELTVESVSSAHHSTVVSQLIQSVSQQCSSFQCGQSPESCQQLLPVQILGNYYNELRRGNCMYIPTFLSNIFYNRNILVKHQSNVNLIWLYSTHTHTCTYVKCLGYLVLWLLLTSKSIFTSSIYQQCKQYSYIITTEKYFISSRMTHSTEL